MVTSHSHSSLDLSALNSDVEYPLPLENTTKKCLIHVKLTESCSKAIDTLISSNKGAVFSLWFTENGGHLTLPSSNGAHTFQFSTAVPNKREQNSTLECFHQLTSQDRQQRLSMIGRLEHKLTVKATDDVYEETKKKAKQLEEERQGVRAKEIKIPKVLKPKLGNNRSSHKSLFDTSLANRSSFGSSGTGAGRGGGGATGVASNKPVHTDSTGRAQQKSLKKRVVHILAIRPCRRADVVSKLKKATKKSESFFSSLDAVLNEVANLQDSTYHLKDHFFYELDVDSWPFYSEAERDLVKRKLKMSCVSSNDNAVAAGFGSMPNMKRSGDDSTVNDHTPPKRPKPPTDPVAGSSSIPTLPLSTSKQTKSSTESITIDQKPHLRPHHHDTNEPPLTNRTGVSSMNGEINDLDSSLPDFERLYDLFPEIASSQQRTTYKNLFNKEYEDYLLLKDKMDRIHAEVLLLSDQLKSLPHNSPEVREVKHKIRKKYIEMQQDTSYQEEKKRLFNLHYKLDHIKKMVMLYDKQ